MSAQKRVSNPEPPEKPTLTIPREEAAKKIKSRIDLGLQLQNKPTNSGEEVENLIKDFEKWNDYNFDLLNSIFTSSQLSTEYRYAGMSGGISVGFGGPPSAWEKLEDRMKTLKRKLQTLESILERLEIIPLSPGVEEFPPEPQELAKRELGNKVFVVHGHDDGAKQTVARFLEKLGLEAIILHEQASGGRTIIEKLEHYSTVDFAVILLTPDDIGASKKNKDDLHDRARQNVILELGYFVGRLGRGFVCALHSAPLELPSDIIGVEYIPMDSHGAWKYKFGKELQVAGFQVDLNKI